MLTKEAKTVLYQLYKKYCIIFGQLSQSEHLFLIAVIFIPFYI